MKDMYHEPVMLEEVLEGLAVRPDGLYVDLTFGGGGHARAVLQRLGPRGRLVAFDQDPQAYVQAQAIRDPRFVFIQANFRFVTRFLQAYELLPVDGVLADLGLSSYQLDTPARGFAQRLEGPLDMRMSLRGGLTAAAVVGTYSKQALTHVLAAYGELRGAQRFAQAIVSARRLQPIRTTQALRRVVQPLVPRARMNRCYAQLFQALRMEVNDELGALQSMLDQLPGLLKPQGRLAVLAYHSLEDRLVKHLIHRGSTAGVLRHDTYGRPLRPLTALSKRVVRPSEAEVLRNPRARSARLRVALLTAEGAV